MKKRYVKNNVNFFTLKSINLVIRVMVMSDVVIFSSFGLITPIFAIFVAGSVNGGSIAVAGLAQAIYMLAKSFSQIPFAIWIDRVKGELDDFWFMFFGTLVFSMIPLAYLLVDSVLTLYLVQFLYGIAHGAMSPAWNAIWVRHIDRGHEGFESGAYTSMLGLGMAFTASIGGFTAEKYGFDALFIAVSIFSLMGTLSLLIAKNSMSTK